MKVRLGTLREFIRENIDCWGGSRPEETYMQCLDDDPAMKKRSVLVPDDIKHAISKWSKAMGLSGTMTKRVW